MAINKVVYGDQTLIDLTSDTATAEDVVEGKTFHDASGQQRTGTGTGSGVVDVEVNGTSVVDPTTKIAEVTSYKEVTESEYEAISVAERESNGIAYFIKDLNNENVQGYPPLIYSDEEREIGVWRDGKPLYQKTIDIAPLPNRTTKEIQLDADIERVISMHGYGIDANDKWDVFLNDVVPTNVSGSVRVFFNTSTKKLYINTGENLTSYTEAYVTIQYTKTTDTAGSGIWNGQGGLAHHYSTSETVIGTWIDGKPRYEITLSGSGSYSAGSELVVPLPTNADKVIIMGGYVDIGTDWLPLELTLGVGTGTTNGVYCYPNKSTGIHIYSSAWTFSEYNVIVQYCKTTD